jgi:exonuclease III
MGKINANGTGRSCGVIILYNNNDWECSNYETDPDGRYIIAVLKDKKTDRIMLITNVYAPNNFNESITFFNGVFDNIEQNLDDIRRNNLNIQSLEICLLGDFNFVINENECRNRAHTASEKRLSSIVTERLDGLGLHDTICFDKDKASHTWTSRGICSRLDRIYCNQFLLNRVFSLEKTWGLAKSDHALVNISYAHITEQRGPGIKGLRPLFLKNQVFVENVRIELLDWVNSTPADWTPHQKWEFCKVGLNTAVGKHTCKQVSLQKQRKSALIKNLTNLKLSIANPTSQDRLAALNQKISAIEAELEDMYEQEAESLFMQSGLKWREEGEKSSKYFLGLVNKRREESTVIQMYDRNGSLVNSVHGILDIARSFYENLYSKVQPATNTRLLESFFTHVPTLNEDEANMLDEPITIDELKQTLKTCKDSSPGPDGIPYSYYKKFDNILLPILLKSWEFSLETGSLPPSQSQACISLLPKTGKDKTRIENWRPISLSNCDIKLITKSMALRLNKVLDNIISTGQSAYIPGRNITNNIRTLRTLRKYAKQHRKDMAIVSLDAKKVWLQISLYPYV